MLGHPAATLSAELIDEILDWVSILGTRSDLFSLRCADQAFVAHSRALIWKGRPFPIQIGSPSELAMAHNILRGDQSFASQLYAISFVVNGNPEPWAVANDDFDSIMTILSASSLPITELYIVPHGKDGAMLYNVPFPEWLASSFLSSTLTKISVSDFRGFPLHTLRACRYLRSLQLKSVDVTTKLEFPASMTELPMPKLEVFDYSGSFVALQGLIENSGSPYACIKSIRMLKAGPGEKRESMQMKQILRGTNSSLEELHFSPHEFSPYTYPFPLSEILKLRDYPKLRKLRVDVKVVKKDHHCWGIIDDIVNLLSSASPGSQALEQVTLHVQYESPIPPLAVRFQESWREIAATIRAMAVLSRRRIDFRVHLGVVNSATVPGEMHGIFERVDGIIHAGVDIEDRIRYHFSIEE